MNIVKIRRIYLIWVLSLILFVNQIQAQVSYSVSFNSNTIQSNEIIGGDGVTYSLIQIDELDYSGDLGEPSLPMKLVKLLIPSNKDIESITINTTGSNVIQNPNPIYPMQEEAPLDGGHTSPDFVTPISTIYNGKGLFPVKRVQTVFDGYFDGANHIVYIGVYPFQFNPKTNDILFVESIDFTLNFKDSGTSPQTVMMRSSNLQPIYDKVLYDLVENKSAIGVYAVKPLLTDNEMTHMRSTTTLPYYDYVIITSDALAPDFGPFVSWKTRKGYSIGIVTTSEIYQAYPNGDLISGISDNAGSIRQYLSDAYYSGTVWALLGGVSTIVPHRKGDESNNSQYGQWTQIPTDLYFADFNGDWDVDSDPNFGEKDDDNPDYLAEIFIGRLPCENSQDIANWTYKVFGYELDPGNGDPSYVMNSFWLRTDGIDGSPTTTASHYPSTFNNTIWPSSTLHDGSEVISHVSNTNYGMIHFYAHGSPNGICTKYYNNPLYNRIFVTDNGCTWGDCSDESGDGLDSYSAKPYYNINYSISCDNANSSDLDIANCPG